MKDNRIKRVLAGTLALLNVAAVTTANVGAYPFTAIVANAEGETQVAKVDFTFDGAEGITSIQYGKNSFEPSFVTYGAINVDVGKEVVVTSESKLEFVTGEGDSETTLSKDSVAETVVDGEYKYTVTVPNENFKVKTIYTELTLDDSLYSEKGGSNIKVTRPGATEEDEPEVIMDADDTTSAPAELKGDEHIITGTKITVTSNKPFNVYNGETASDGTPIVTSGTYDNAVKAYILKDYCLETKNLNIVSAEHTHILEYTNLGNILEADCTTPEKDIVGAQAAFLGGYAYQEVEVEVEGEEDDDTMVDFDPTEQESATETEYVLTDFANNGKYTYNPNDDGGVEVRFKRDFDILGYGGNTGALSEDELTAFEFTISKDGQVVNSGVIRKGEDDLAQDDGNYTTKGAEKFEYVVDDEEGEYVYIDKFTDIGHYDISVTVWGQNIKDAAYKLNYSFDIVSQEINIKDFDLCTLSLGEFTSDDNDDEEKGAPPLASEEFTEVFGKDIVTFDEKEGLYTIELPKGTPELDETTGKKYFAFPVGTSTTGEVSYVSATIALTARLSAKAEEEYSDLNYGPEGYQVVNAQVGSELNKINEIVIEIYDERYGGSKEEPKTVTIKWQFVEEGQEDYLYFDGNTKTELPIKGKDAKDEESIEDCIRQRVRVFGDKYDESKVSFKYRLETGTDTELDLEQLDGIEDGVPTEEGRYRVFLCYDGDYVKDYDESNARTGEKDKDEDQVEFIFVNIDKSDYEIKTDNKEITYGDAVELGDYVVYDFLNQESDVKIDESTLKYSVYEAESYTSPDGEKVYWRRYEPLEGKEDVVNPGLLDAGLYAIDIEAATSNDKKASGTFYINVKKKEITADMIGQIKRQYEDGKSVYVDNLLAVRKAENPTKQTVTDNMVVVQDRFSYTDTEGKSATQENDIFMTVVGGTSTAVRVGTYNVSLGISALFNVFVGGNPAVLGDLNDEFNTSAWRNYTVTGRSVDTTWSVVDGENVVSFRTWKSVDGKDMKARLFNGGKIHIAIDRADTEQKLEAFGVIYDKTGKLAAPGTDALALDSAKKALVVGGEFPSASNPNKTSFGANITPVNVETGVWVRPYLIDENGVVSYGDPEYFDLTTVTQNELNLRIAGQDGTDVKIANAEDAKTDGISENDVILSGNGYDYTDKKGISYNVGPWEILKKDDKGNATGVDRRVYYIATVKNALPAIEDDEAVNRRSELAPERFGFVYDKNGLINAPADAKHISADEYAEVNKLLLADNTKYCQTYSSESNSNHGPNARGANITPADTMTGVWVRTFVDFGNDLIVYTDPIYFDNFNDYYKEAYGIKFGPLETNADCYGDNAEADAANNGKAITVNDDHSKFAFYIKASAQIKSDYNGEYYGVGKGHTIDFSKSETNETQAVGIALDKSGTITDPKKLVIGASGTVSATYTVKKLWSKTSYKGVFGANCLKTDAVNVRPAVVIDDNLTIYGDIIHATFEQAEKEGMTSWNSADYNKPAEG